MWRCVYAPLPSLCVPRPHAFALLALTTGRARVRLRRRRAGPCLRATHCRPPEARSPRHVASRGVLRARRWAWRCDLTARGRTRGRVREPARQPRALHWLHRLVARPHLAGHLQRELLPVGRCSSIPLFLLFPFSLAVKAFHLHFTFAVTSITLLLTPARTTWTRAGS